MEQTTPSMTSGQKRDLRRLFADALNDAGLSKDAAQRVLKRGGQMKTGIAEILKQLSASDLLESVGSATVPAIATFMAKEHFKDDRSGPVAIGWIGDNFRSTFLAGDGMVEGAVPEATLRIYRLVKNSVDSPIIAELGEAVAETTLGQMYEMMKAQGHGEQGNLLTNGYANIFYVRDAKNVLWAVHCLWYSDFRCWYVNACPVTDPGTWNAGYQVVSR